MKQIRIQVCIVIFLVCFSVVDGLVAKEHLLRDAGTNERPNILYIMSDDHACNAISAYGGRLADVAPTPNIDRIAREGIRLDKCFVTNSICTPSRAVILSGQHSHVNGVRTLGDAFPGPDSGTPNVAEDDARCRP